MFESAEVMPVTIEKSDHHIVHTTTIEESDHHIVHTTMSTMVGDDGIGKQRPIGPSI
jgi:hypothetical protein